MRDHQTLCGHNPNVSPPKESGETLAEKRTPMPVDPQDGNVRALVLSDQELPETHHVNTGNNGHGKCVEHIHGSVKRFC